MSVFSSQDSLKVDNLFDVAYHVDFISSIREAGKHQMSKEEVASNSQKVFEHPSINLSLLFDKLRHFGEPLSSSDRGSIQEFVQECKSDVDSLQTKISETISTIGQLCRSLSEESCRLAQRKDQARLGDYLLTASPAAIQSLPQEVLEEIFLTCFYSTGSTKSHSGHAPLQVAAVCHQWRMIALGVPALWRYISMHTASARSFDRGRQWLQRCRLPFLSLDIHKQNQQFEELLVLLKQPSIRIRALEVVFASEDEALQSLPTILGCNSEELEELVVRDQYQLAELPVPSLKRLYTHKVPVSWTTTPPPPQLTLLFVTMPVHWSLLEQILLQCPCLQRTMLSVGENGTQLSCGTEPNDIVSPSKSGPHVLADLVSFGFVNDCKEENLPSDLLRNFSFPVLRAFEYYVEHQDRESLTWLTSHDILPHIQRLTLQLPHLMPEMLTKFIESAYTLEELSISCKLKTFQDILQPLTDIPSSYPQSITLPQLKALQFTSQTCFSEIQESAPQLRQLAQAWSTPVEGRPHRLTHLKILCWNSTDDHAADLRDAILQEGELDLQLEVVHFSTSTWLSNVPIAFEMYQPPFSEIRTRKIFQADGNWKVRYGPVYDIAD
ncbi:hypothetical protein BDN72DRAFT_964568 [Pluteus cervinus]|uniref:Uncharacterized protein n=1 Tax=Pluteus cervinus TaxID=181527 RepID=A0ACD3A9W9_9AGAR|nr:hypothetical protein BDN72DRAFT_964568 [Pluteus cervinus]